MPKELNTEVEAQIETETPEAEVTETQTTETPEAEESGDEGEESGPKTLADLQDEGAKIDSLDKPNTNKAKPGQKSTADEQDETSDEETPAGEGEEGEEGEFKAALKFTVHGKELAMDPRLEGVIKTKEHEEILRDLYTKVEGFELIKPKYQERTQQVQEFQRLWQEEVTPQRQSIEMAKQALAADDMETVIEVLGLPKEKIFRYVANQLRYQEMSPQERADADRARRLQQESYRVPQVNDQLTQATAENRKLAQDMRYMQLDFALSQGAQQDVVKMVDAKLGQVGAFKQKVMLFAADHAKRTGEDLTVEQAIEAVAKEYRAFVVTEQPKPAKQGLTAQEKVVKVASKKPPVIPSISGRGTSPARKEISRISDLRKLAKQASAVDLDE